MPFYEYKCLNESCEKEFEIEQKINDPKLTTCPECHENTLMRLISFSSFKLEGSGWYADGYSSTKKSE